MKSRFARNGIRLILSILIGIAFVASNALAQSENGSIAGHITDSSGGLLQGAEIKLQPTGRTVVTNQQGSYYINNLAPGSYTMTITYVGFSASTKTVSVTAGQTIAVEV